MKAIENHGPMSLSQCPSPVAGLVEGAPLPGGALSGAFSEDGRPGSAPAFPVWVAWTPVALLHLCILLFWLARVQSGYTAPYLLLGLNFIFSTATSALVVYLVVRSFLLKPDWSLLLLGCGVLIWGTAGVVSNLASPDDPNGQITIFNLSVFVSAGCHLAGALLPLLGVRLQRPGPLALVAGFTAALLVVALAVVWNDSGTLPLFFIQGQGGTPIRQAVLGSAALMFAVTAGLLLHIHTRSRSPFLQWYAPATALLATGLLGVMVQSLHGGWVGWFGRASQWLGGIYMLAAGLSVSRASRVWNLSLEARLKLNESKLDLALEAADIGTWTYDLQSHSWELGPRGQKLYNLPSAHVLHDREQVNQIFHPEDIVPMWEAVARACDPAGDGRYQAEYRVRGAGGDWRWLQAWGRVEFERPGSRPRRIIGVSRDITEQKRAQSDLAEKARLLDLTKDAILVRDGQDRIVYWNTGATRLYGYSPAEALGRTPDELLHTEVPGGRAAVVQEFQAQKSWEGELIHTRKDGCRVTTLSRWVADSDSAGRIRAVLQTDNDITVRKEAEAILARSKEELEALASERTIQLQEVIEDLEHFSYSITHDMRAPLRGMRGFSELMAESCQGCRNEESLGFMGRIRTSAARMDLLITDALQYAKAARQQLPLHPVDPEPLLRGILESYPGLQPDLADIEIVSPLPRVIANEAGLTQVFSNLLGNAVKFVKKGTRPHIRIGAEPAPATTGPANPGDGAPAPGMVRLYVQDNGIGMDAVIQRKIFQMFGRGHGQDTYEGTGIGLALVKKVAQHMGGSVGVWSAPDQGSRFWIELPADQSPRR